MKELLKKITFVIFIAIAVGILLAKCDDYTEKNPPSKMPPPPGDPDTTIIKHDRRI